MMIFNIERQTGQRTRIILTLTTMFAAGSHAAQGAQGLIGQKRRGHIHRVNILTIAGNGDRDEWIPNPKKEPLFELFVTNYNPKKEHAKNITAQTTFKTVNHGMEESVQREIHFETSGHEASKNKDGITIHTLQNETTTLTFTASQPSELRLLGYLGKVAGSILPFAPGVKHVYHRGKLDLIECDAKIISVKIGSKPQEEFKGEPLKLFVHKDGFGTTLESSRDEMHLKLTFSKKEEYVWNGPPVCEHIFTKKPLSKKEFLKQSKRRTQGGAFHAMSLEHEVELRLECSDEVNAWIFAQLGLAENLRAVQKILDAK